MDENRSFEVKYINQSDAAKLYLSMYHKANDVQQHLRRFLIVAVGSTSPSKTPKTPNWSSMTLKDLTDSPMFLLKNVPICKSAVFDYCRLVVIENAHLYLCQLENPSSADPGVMEDAVVEISKTLRILVDTNPGNWLSPIFQWSLESLAEMSKRFYGRRYLNNKTLSDLLKIYTANQATNSILELLNFCAGHLLNSSPEKCVAALLEAAVRYGVFCDWILTYISIAYPLKMINQLVNCGLNDFISHTADLSKNMPLNQAVQRCEQYNREKLSSLASILSHLAVQKSTELRHCFAVLIEQALSTDTFKKRQDVLAFLLKLCIFSRNVMDVLMKDLPKYSSTQNLIKIIEALSVMPSHVLFSDQSPATAIINIISLFNDHDDITFALDQLTKFAFSDVEDFLDGKKNVADLMRNRSLHILRIMVCNMENIIHSQYVLSIDRFPMLKRLDENFVDTVVHLITICHKAEESHFYFKLICLLCMIRGAEKTALVLAIILFKAKEVRQLALFVDFCNILSPFMPKLSQQFLTKMSHFFNSLQSSIDVETTAWTSNLLTLIEWERSACRNDYAFLNISKAISENYHNFVMQIYVFLFETFSSGDLDTFSCLLNILLEVGPPIRLSLAEIYRVVTSCIRLLFVNLSAMDSGYPALWYSLPLLQSILASVMIQLEASIDKKGKISNEIKTVLSKWFTVVKEGKILVNPLGRLFDVIQKVCNYEAFLILLQIWKYFQAYWPDLSSLDKHFECRLQLNDKSILSGDPIPYLAPIRPIMQANIASVGHLFRTLFQN